MSVPQNLRIAFVAMTGMAVTACTTLSGGSGNWRATTSVVYSEDDQDCLNFFRGMQATSKREGYAAADWTVPGFPYLRADRFLASFSDEVDTREAFDEWVLWLGETADTTLVYERELQTQFNSEDYERCRDDLIGVDFSTEEGRNALRQAVRSPEAYDDWKRVAGLYPVTRLFMASGYERWKKNYLEQLADRADDEKHIRYAIERFQMPSVFPGEEESYAHDCANKGPGCGMVPVRPIAAREASIEVDRARQASALGIPYLSERLFHRLAYTHAPVFKIETDKSFDRIGTPELTRESSGKIAVSIDTERPRTFVRFGYTRFQGNILPQITYLIWFEERPKDGPFDLIGGDLDGVMWRVTIGLDGKPLVYDSAHACGCYHLFFPVPPTKRKPMPEDDDLREEALVPFDAPALADDESLVVRLSSADHYVVGLGKDRRETDDDARRYDIQGPAYFHGEVFGQDAALHIIPVDGQEEDFQSIYGRNGIITQSARLERWLLWPSGIASPGAMRAWGQHATSFVGKRHFDDPYLLQEAFER